MGISKQGMYTVLFLDTRKWGIRKHLCLLTLRSNQWQVTHLLPIQTSEERQFVALATALDQVLSRGRSNARVLAFLGLGQRATCPSWPALAFTNLCNRKVQLVLAVLRSWSQWIGLRTETISSVSQQSSLRHLLNVILPPPSLPTKCLVPGFSLHLLWRCGT